MVPLGSALGFGDRSQDIGVGRSEMEGGGMVVENDSEVGGGKIIEGFVGEEEMIVLYILLDSVAVGGWL